MEDKSTVRQFYSFNLDSNIFFLNRILQLMQKSWPRIQPGTARKQSSSHAHSHLAHAPSPHTNLHLAATSGVRVILTEEITLKAICPVIMKECKCYCPIVSWDTSWFRLRAVGITTLWVSSNRNVFSSELCLRQASLRYLKAVRNFCYAKATTNSHRHSAKCSS